MAAAGAVVDDWSHHIEMMKDKEHIDPAQYGQQWREMVQTAPANLDRFARASLELTNHATAPTRADAPARPVPPPLAAKSGALGPRLVGFRGSRRSPEQSSG